MTEHRLTHYRDIVLSEDGTWVTRPGVECEVCGELWPCEAARRDEPGEG